MDLRTVRAVLLASGQVRDAEVVERSAGLTETSGHASHAGAKRTRLIAYVVADEWLRVRELRSYLTDRLPEHLVPSAFVLVEHLSREPEEERHWSVLPVPSPTRPDLDSPYAPPRNVVEQVLSELWASALGLDEVGIHDHFVELGGDSLTAVKLLTAIEERFGHETVVASLFDWPTIASFAREVFGNVNAAMADAPDLREA